MDAVSSPSNSDIDVVRLAREIAMDIQPLNKILEQYAISNETWSELQRNSRFRMILACEAEAWSTAMNVHERVKVKSAAMLEEFLPELYARMNDREQAFPGGNRGRENAGEDGGHRQRTRRRHGGHRRALRD